jgi:hypothetical protein
MCGIIEINIHTLKLTVMKKLLLTAIASGIITISSFAQTTTTASTSAVGDSVKLNIGAEAALPINQNVYSYGYGGAIKFEVPVAHIIYLTLSTGIELLQVKSEFTTPGSPSSDYFFPLEVGGKYYLSSGLYGELQTGVSFSAAGYSGPGIRPYYAYSAGLGYTFHNGLEVGARYGGWFNNGTLQQVALRLAIQFQ